MARTLELVAAKVSLLQHAVDVPVSPRSAGRVSLTELLAATWRRGRQALQGGTCHVSGGLRAGRAWNENGSVQYFGDTIWGKIKKKNKLIEILELM